MTASLWLAKEEINVLCEYLKRPLWAFVVIVRGGGNMVRVLPGSLS